VLNGVLSRDQLLEAWRDATGQSCIAAQVCRSIDDVGIDIDHSAPPSCLDWRYCFNSGSDSRLSIPLHALSCGPDMAQSSVNNEYRAAVIVSVNSLHPSSHPGWVGATHIMSAPDHPLCQIKNMHNTQAQVCTLSSMVNTKFASEIGFQSYTFNPLTTDNANALLSVGTAFEVELNLDFPFTCKFQALKARRYVKQLIEFPVNKTSPPPLNNGSPTREKDIEFYEFVNALRISLYDPELFFRDYREFSEYSLPEGPSNLISSTPITLADKSLVQLTAQGSRIFDRAQVLPGRATLVPRNQSGSSPIDVWDYTYYDTQTNNDNNGMRLTEASYCNVAGPNFAGYHTPCWLLMTVRMRSPLFTTQTSSHGTTALKILIDEGGILGAIFFFTWFAGIYVI